MSSEYADAVRDFDLADASLRQAFAKPEPPVYLPAPLPSAAVVHQPVPLPAPGPRVDTLSVRLLAGGGSIALAGLGVDLAGNGIKVAGPYLWALAGVMAGLALVIALLKSKTGAQSGGTQVNINGGKNRVRSIR